MHIWLRKMKSAASPVFMAASGRYTANVRLSCLMAALLAPAGAMSQIAGTGNAGAAGPAASTAAPASSGTLRAVGVTANGGPAGTSGTDPGTPSSTPSNVAPAAATSGTTLRPVGTNVDGSAAGTTGTTPGSQTLSNPLNRNPATRAAGSADSAPATDSSSSTSTPTAGAVATPDSRDTVVAPDPSRDSTTNPVANPPR